MVLKRMFSTQEVKGCRDYLDTQRTYEWVRTMLYFAVSLSLFLAGIFTTGSRMNLLTIVAVLGCLPASKSLVEAVMFTKYRSFCGEEREKMEAHAQGLCCLYDMVFTSREHTWPVMHMAVRGNTVIGYLPGKNHIAVDCAVHLNTCLKADNINNISIKLFDSISKYTDRLDSLRELPEDEKLTEEILNILKSISL